MVFNLSMKKRDMLSEDTSDDDLPIPPYPKRRALNPSSPLQTCTIHRVHCTQTKNHAEHPDITYFEDHPRLFEGDCKASALRGQIQIPDISEYLESRSHLKFVFYRIYSCDAYHVMMDETFRPLERPKNPFVKSLLPFFYNLDSDGDPAISNDKSILVSSEDLLDALRVVTKMDTGILQNLDEPHNTRLLATQLYHHRWIRKDPSGLGDVGLASIELVIELIDLVEDMFGDEFDEADALFAEGRVTKLHLPKLFPAGSILVTTEQGEPFAYTLDADTSTGISPQLACWAWRFDGQFWKYTTTFQVQFPFRESQVAITDFSIYPLKYAKSGMQERLLERGRQFWSLRNGNYVSYQSSNIRKDGQNMVSVMSDIDVIYNLNGRYTYLFETGQATLYG